MRGLSAAAPASMLALAAACGSVEPVELDASTLDELGAALVAAHQERGTAGVAWAILGQEGQAHVGAAGLASTEPVRAWSPSDPYPIASVSKLYTLAMVLQLVDEGELDLDDPVERWVATPWDGEGITVRHLCQHTSGIASYNWVGSFDGSRAYTPDELVAWAAQHEPELGFAPGTAWAYSNTNYVLLGQIIEAVDARSYGASLDARVLGPLELADTSLPDANPGDLVRGYDEAGTDLTESAHPSVGWAAGGIVSTPADVARFTRALFHGELVSQARLDEISTPLVLPDGSSPGVGLGVFGGIDPDYGGAWGHTGGSGGHQAYTTHVELPDLVLVVFANHEDAQIEPMATRGWEVVLPR